MAGRYVQVNDGVRRVWNVERIWRLAEALPAVEIAVDEIRGPDEVTWFSETQQPTVRSVVDHCRRILQCDLSFPVILTQDNCVFDGMHRLARHILDGRTTIQVKSFAVNPEPDETG
jgi:hypothetical protein